MSGFNFTAVTYSLHKCSETILWLKLKQQFTVHVSAVSCALKFTEAKKNCHRVVRTSIWSILYSGDLYSKKLYRQDLRDDDSLTHVLLHGKSDAIEGVPDKLLKGAAMVFRVHRDVTNCC